MNTIKRRPKRIRKKKPLWRNLYFRLTVLGFTLFLELLYLFIFSPIFQIKDILVAAPLQIPNNVVRDLIEKTAAKKFLFWQTKSIFLYNAKRAGETISEKFLQLGDVQIKRKLPGTLVVQMQNRYALFQWCGKDQCFLVDRQGILFQEEFITQPAPDFLIFSERDDKVRLGQKVLDAATLERILDISEQLNKELKIETKNFIIASDKFIAKTAQGVEIYFDLDGDIPEQFFNLKVLLEKQINLQESSLEYIDLRFGNKLYYK
jgi:cell division septal protein FtsQ